MWGVAFTAFVVFYFLFLVFQVSSGLFHCRAFQSVLHGPPLSMLQRLLSVLHSVSFLHDLYQSVLQLLLSDLYSSKTAVDCFASVSFLHDLYQSMLQLLLSDLYSSRTAVEQQWNSSRTADQRQ